MAGLRERKKQRTRELIQREAIRLFESQGYDATTVEQIAAAAEISPSTFFNYFGSKEDVVLLDAYDPVVMSEVQSRPADESLADSLVAALSGPLATMLQRDRELIWTRTRIMLEVPSLRARMWDELQRSEQFICSLLAERTGRDTTDFELRVTAGVVMGALMSAIREWAATGGRDDFLELMRRAVRVVEAGGVLGQPARRRPATTAPNTAQQGRTTRR